MAAIEVESLTKWYGATRAAEGVTFGVEPGEIFGLLGPNGAGKTTTIRCIMGLIRPTAGRVRILGAAVRPGRATQHGRIGYLPGEFRIWPRVAAGRALGLLAALGRAEAAGDRRRELAERLELDLRRPVGDLSKGNRQKVAIVYAFQHQPDILILDEPTSGLDPLMRQTVLDLVREAAAAGAAVLLSSHDLAEVSAVCRRAAILREGRLVEMAPIAEIVHQGESRLQVWFSDATLTPEPPRLAGVRVIEQTPGMMHLAFQGPAAGVLEWLCGYAVDRIATPQISLEEAFMQYYRRPGQEGPAAKGGGR